MTYLRSALVRRLHGGRFDFTCLRVPGTKVACLLHWSLPLPKLRRCMMKHPAGAPMPIPSVKQFDAFEALDVDRYFLHLSVDKHPHRKLLRQTVRRIAVCRPHWSQGRRWGDFRGVVTGTTGAVTFVVLPCRLWCMLLLLLLLL